MNYRSQDTRDTRIIVFTRFPEPGQAKTRLIPFLGPRGAADLQRNMTEFTLAQARQTGVSVHIGFVGGDFDRMRAWLGDDYEYIPQGDGDLGKRMERAFAKAFDDGARKVLIVGCDCPDNRSANMLDAIAMLNKTPCVIGPAADGGYYLIGLSGPQPELFAGIDWGTDRVLSQTIAKTSAYSLLPVLHDVDRAQDIPPAISVIIPALNEEQSIGASVTRALAGFTIDVIVADGGSSDATRENAAQAGATVLSLNAGRAQQMNRSAQKSTGDIIVFLHADSILPDNWDCHVRRLMRECQTAMGCFLLSIENSFFGKRLIELMVNLRTRWLKKPYGDQALFLRRHTFELLGGYPDIPILEEIELVKRAARLGRICCVNKRVRTSGRRWERLGELRTTWYNQAVLAAAMLGADLHLLRQAYEQGTNPLRVLITKKTPRSNNKKIRNTQQDT